MMKLRGTDLSTVINRVLDTLGNREQVLFFSTDPEKNMVEVSGQNDLYVVKKSIPAVISKAKRFALDGDRAAKTFNYKDNLTFSLKDNALRFKAEKSSFNGELFTKEFETVKRLKRKNTQAVDPAIADLLFKKLRKAALKPSYDEGMVLLAMVRSNKNSISIIAGDRYHGAKLSQPWAEKGVKMNFDFPISYIDLVEKLIGNKVKFELQFDPNCMYVFSDTLELSLPLVGSAVVTYDVMNAGFESFNTPTSFCSVESTDLKTALKALSSIHDPDTTVLSAKLLSKKLIIKCSSKYGNITEQVDVKDCVTDEKQIILDAKSVDDIISKLTGTVQFKLFADTACLFEQVDNGLTASYLAIGKTE